LLSGSQFNEGTNVVIFLDKTKNPVLFLSLVQRDFIGLYRNKIFIKK